MFNVGDRILLNKELCPEENRSNQQYQFGSLNYFSLFLGVEFEIVRMFKDEYHGEMLELKTEDVRFSSLVVFKQLDVVLSNSLSDKIKFEIISRVNNNQDLIDEIKEEIGEKFSERSSLKKSGKRATEKPLTDNWSEIKILRSKLEKLEKTSEVVVNVRHSSGTYLIKASDESEIPKLLTREIRAKRNERKKIIPTVKRLTSDLSYEKVGGVLTKAGRFSEMNEKYAVKLIKEHKKPTTADNYVGIEIEMLSPKTIEEMNKEFIKARLHRYVNVGTDGSVHAEIDSFHAMELRVCVPEQLLESKLKEICKVLRDTDCYANRSCGMHVHIDMRQRDPELCYRNFFKVQDIMINSQPKNRRDGQYCRTNTDSELALDDFGGDRYKVINTASYHKKDMRTIEIRVHEGATKFKDIINWTKFLVATASLKSDLSSPIKNIAELKDAAFLSSDVISHLENRIEEFSA